MWNVRQLSVMINPAPRKFTNRLHPVLQIVKTVSDTVFSSVAGSKIRGVSA